MVVLAMTTTMPSAVVSQSWRSANVARCGINRTPALLIALPVVWLYL